MPGVLGDRLRLNLCPYPGLVGIWAGGTQGGDARPVPEFAIEPALHETSIIVHTSRPTYTDAITELLDTTHALPMKTLQAVRLQLRAEHVCTKQMT